MDRVFFAILLFSLTISYSIEKGLSQQQPDLLTEDRWIWGYFNESKTEDISERYDQPVTETGEVTTPITVTSPKPLFGSLTTTEPLPDYCLPYNRTKKNFKKPGRRISLNKCFEYVYEMNVRKKEYENSLKCTRYFNEKYHVGGATEDSSIASGEYPHMGAIGWKAVTGTWVFKCGSSLISDNFVLTAAQCAKAPSSDTSIADPVPKIVRLGDKNILDSEKSYNKPEDVNIRNIIVHPEYKSPKQYYDIALIELDERVKFSKFIHPACLRNSYKPGTHAVLTGWGVVEAASRDISPELQAATVDIMDPKVCDDLLKPSCNGNWCGMKEHQLCAGKLAGGLNACQGYSGGPLQVKLRQYTTIQGQMHYVVGVISFGCDHPNLPGMYTRVSSFYDWIESIVWRDEITS